MSEWYGQLSDEQLVTAREQLDERYWNAYELLGAIAAERAVLLNEMKGREYGVG
jgi:hypothetical protein